MQAGHPHEQRANHRRRMRWRSAQQSVVTSPVSLKGGSVGLEKLAGGPLTFGRLIQAIRLGEEESLASFAERLGVTRQNLRDIEAARARR